MNIKDPNCQFYSIISLYSALHNYNVNLYLIMELIGNSIKIACILCMRRDSGLSTESPHGGWKTTGNDDNGITLGKASCYIEDES